jgi:gluconate 2-dehydrogenase
MQKSKVLCTYTLDADEIAQLESVVDLIYNPKAKFTNEVLELIADCDGYLNFYSQIDEELLEAAKKLKIVSNVGVGYNSFNIEEMKKRGVIGTYTPHVLDITVADLIITLMLSTARRVAEMDSLMREGRWAKTSYKDRQGLLVTGQKLGIIGMGRIGETVAKKAIGGFDMKVSYHNRNRKLEAENNLGVKYESMDELLKTSDFIVLMTPLTDETRELISEREFGLMKNTTIFVNASRGHTVNEKHLINALKTGQIWGAGLDVFQKEPIEENNELLSLKNTVLLPHLGASVTETQKEMKKVAIDAIVDYFSGNKPKYIVPELEDLGKV